MGTWLNHAEMIINSLNEMSREEIDAFRKMLLDRTGTVWVCGNGGSAANSAHFAEDLAKFWDRAVFALGQSQPMTTMIGNDYGYDSIFKNELNWLCKNHDASQDVFVGISVSGKSKNVIDAAKLATNLGMKVVAMTGPADSPLSQHADLTIRSPLQENGYAEDLHMIILHWIVEASPLKDAP